MSHRIISPSHIRKPSFSIPIPLEEELAGFASQHFLITGGSGFIGQHLTKALLHAGHKVSVWTRNRIQAEKRLPHTALIIENLSELNQQDPVDVIVNLAGSSLFSKRWSNRYKKELLRSRIALTETLLNWVTHSSIPPRLLISTSSIYYYTNHELPKMVCVDEEITKKRGFIADTCEQWEKAALAFEALHIPVVRLRLGLVLGNGEGGILANTLRQLRWKLGAVYGSGQQPIGWIHIDDLIRIIHWLAQKRPMQFQQKVYNAVSPYPVQQAEWIHTIANTYGYKVHWHLSTRLLFWILGQRAELYLYCPRVIPAALLAEGFCFSYPDLINATTQLQRSASRFS